MEDAKTDQAAQDQETAVRDCAVCGPVRPLVAPIALAVAVADQITKAAVVSGMGFHDAIHVIPGFFDIRKVFNYGAAWGIMEGHRIFLVAISAGMLALLWHSRRDFLKSGRMCRIGVGLLVGGIIGNLIDRVKLGYVVDFLDFHWRGWSFPAFNIADSAICVGILLYFISTLVAHRRG